jgi:hypothetical protein
VASIKEKIRIEGPYISDNRVLSFRLFITPKFGRFFLSDQLNIEYPLNVDSVNESILCIPAFASIVTLAWCVGADIYIKSLDSRYLECMDEVKAVLKSWYPKLSFSSKIITKPIENNYRGGRFGLLFTGGVDSTTSYIKFRDKDLRLFSVSGQGGSIDAQSQNERLLPLLSNKKEKSLLIKTNVEKVVNEKLVLEKFGLNWWMNLSHGVVLSGHCAPLSVVEEVGSVILASSFTRDFNFPWGSHPSLDNKICWGSTKVVHDGFETTRQEKIMYIINEYIKETGKFPPLKVCSRYKLTGKNCGRCEKCSRTVIGLLSEGIDPNRCGFNITAGSLVLIKKILQSGGYFGRRGIAERPAKLINRLYPIFEWEDIQLHLPKKIDHNLYDSLSFFEWFRCFDIRKRVSQIKLSQIPRLFLYSFFDFLAPASSLLPSRVQSFLRRSFDYFFIKN